MADKVIRRIGAMVLFQYHVVKSFFMISTSTEAVNKIIIIIMYYYYYYYYWWLGLSFLCATLSSIKFFILVLYQSKKCKSTS